MKSCTSSVPGTCGELFQGSLDGIPCLVSCPVDRMARLRITEMPSGGVVCPPDMSKTKRALELALDERQCRVKSLLVERLNALPEGKGYASSTADILAAVSGLAALSGEPFDPERATRTALAVEPTDSIAWPGLALLAHRDGRVMEFLGPPPAMSVYILDWGGTVDTGEFNRKDMKDALSAMAPLHREAFSLVKAGVEQGDPGLVGKGASLSAGAWSVILEKPHLEECFRLCARLDGYGVCIAHSGTLYGVLLPGGGKMAEEEILRQAGEVLSPGWEGRLQPVVCGGPRVEERNDG